MNLIPSLIVECTLFMNLEITCMIDESKRQRKKHTRKRKKKEPLYQAERINSLRVAYSKKHKGFIVTHFSDTKNILFKSEWNKQEAVNWALRHAHWATLRIDKYKALVREFLLKSLGNRILDQNGVVMEEVNQNTARVFADNELIFEIVKLGRDCLIKFYDRAIHSLYEEIERCDYFPFGRPRQLGKGNY